MSKPIFILRFPEQTEVSRLNQAAESLAKHGFYEDYHCLVIKDKFTGGEIKFECYNAPHTEMEFKELQERVLTLLNQNK
jgi:hypothetical protein